MVDAEKVRDLLAHLDELVPLLEETRAEGATRFLASKRVQHQTEREVQLAVQVCIDAGAHLVAQLGLGAPDDYRDVFLRLAQAGVISRELAERLGEAARMRNLLVHGYRGLLPERIFAALDDLDDLRIFAQAALTAAERD